MYYFSNCIAFAIPRPICGKLERMPRHLARPATEELLRAARCWRPIKPHLQIRSNAYVQIRSHHQGNIMILEQRRSSRRLRNGSPEGPRSQRIARPQLQNQVLTKRLPQPVTASEPIDGDETQSEIIVLSPEPVRILDTKRRAAQDLGHDCMGTETTKPEQTVANPGGDETQLEIAVPSSKALQLPILRGVKRKRQVAATKRASAVADTAGMESVLENDPIPDKIVLEERIPRVKRSSSIQPTALPGPPRRTRRTQNPSSKRDFELEPTGVSKPESNAMHKSGRSKRILEAQHTAPSLRHKEEAQASILPDQHEADSAKSDLGEDPSTPPPPRGISRRILGSGSIRKWISYVRYPSPDSVHSSDIGSGQETPQDDAPSEPEANRGGLFNFQISPIKFGSRPNHVTKSSQPKPAWRNLDAG